jgi:hypothetical protein
MSSPKKMFKFEKCSDFQKKSDIFLKIQVVFKWKNRKNLSGKSENETGNESSVYGPSPEADWGCAVPRLAPTCSVASSPHALMPWFRMI